ncbi:hypothetical protein [Flavobacterium sp.]|uniref:hypothetical protein n=1 Tax=Flavobacterium sp. TaxID=239 RepID=UPI00374FE5F6
MVIVQKYDIQIEEWSLEDFRKFEGENQENLIHEFGISPRDPKEPNCCYFNVGIQKTIDNSKNGRVFSAKATTIFKIKNDNQIPSVEFCFDILDNGTFEFAKFFNERKQNTYVFDKKIPIPQIADFRKELESVISFWDRNIRNTGLN